METTATYSADVLPIKPSKLPWIILGIILVITLGIGSYLYFKMKPNTQTYSAVFLTSGQVYFGKLNGNVLTNVYFLQQEASSTALIPITAALHQPTNSMTLYPQNILFTETLSSTSPIVSTINKK